MNADARIVRRIKAVDWFLVIAVIVFTLMVLAGLAGCASRGESINAAMGKTDTPGAKMVTKLESVGPAPKPEPSRNP